jgi:anti-sigma factor RsiW
MTDPAAAAVHNFDDDDLVAYLDGELDAENARRVEQLLASDIRARQRLRELQYSWDLLDQIPRPEVSSEFTQTTVSMIAVQEAQSLALDRRSIAGRLWQWLVPMAGVVLAAALGYWAMTTLYRSPERRLLHDMSLIENMDMYSAAESVDFLRTLKREDLFVEEPSDEL